MQGRSGNAKNKTAIKTKMVLIALFFFNLGGGGGGRFFECVNPKKILALIFTKIYTFCPKIRGGGRGGPSGPLP